MMAPLAKLKAGFVDQAAVSIQAGRGGKGCRSFYKDLWSRHPIPDGGDGGRGGDVLIQANRQLTTLLDFQSQRLFRAQSGGNASSKRKHGAQGKDCFMEVPLGTIVRDADTGDLIREILETKDTITVARGGAGGIGNASQRKRSDTQKNRFDPELLGGQPGESRRLQLELKLVADAGIVGLPNAGKSTLLSKISHAHPKIAAFPFTTVHPLLGAVALPDGEPLIAVDVPGLIEGAHCGKGLGLDFLRHIERTRLLIHLIDMAGQDGRDPVDDYETLHAELKAYRKEVAEKPEIVVANKMDCPEAKKHLTRFKKAVKEKPVLISAKTGEGIDKLLEALSGTLERVRNR